MLPSLALLTLVGCTTGGSQKVKGAGGYVDFCPIGHFGYPIEIYEVTDDGWKGTFLGRAGYITKNAKVRVALPAGPHTFSLGLGSAHQSVHATVLPGSVTPIRIEIADHQESSEFR